MDRDPCAHRLEKGGAIDYDRRHHRGDEADPERLGAVEAGAFVVEQLRTARDRNQKPLVVSASSRTTDSSSQAAILT